MPYHESFYYLSETDATGFSKNPPGTLYYDRLILDKPCWKKTTQAYDLYPKTIIIADSSAPNWSFEQKDTVNSCIQELLQVGFHLYAWTEGELRKLDVKGLSLVDLKCMTDIDLNTVRTSATQQLGRSEDKIQILSAENMDLLTVNQNTQPLTIEKLELSSSAMTDDELLETLRNQSFHCLKLENYKNALSNMIDILSQKPELEAVELYHGEFTSDDLAILLQRLPKLRALRIEECTGLTSSMTQTIQESSFLESLEMHNTPFTGENLAKILPHTPKLQQLALENCGKLSGGFLDAKLDNLESLQCQNPLGDSCLDQEDIVFIHTHATHLRTLLLSDLYDPQYNENHTLKNITTLEYSLLGVEEYNQLKDIHSQFPHLKTLRGLFSPQGEAFDDISKFEHLESLSLKFLILDKIVSLSKDGKKFTDFLSTSKTIKTLTLISSHNFVDFDESIIFESLENLILIGSSSFIPSHAPHLKRLIYSGYGSDLVHCYKLFDMLDKFKPLPSLEQLELPDHMIDIVIPMGNTKKTRILTELLQKCPNLQEPSLSRLLQLIEQSTKMIEQSTRPNERPILDLPRHDPNEFINKPPDKEAFRYTGLNKTKNQKMVIEKLCQYLTLSQKHIALIPLIQKGICVALCHLPEKLGDAPYEVLNGYLERLSQWDGKNIDIKLTPFLEVLIDTIHTHQLEQRFTPQGSTYVGGKLAILSKKMTTPYMLVNPWHAIKLFPLPEKNQTVIYDPNNTVGAMLMPNENLPSIIECMLGSLVCIKELKIPLEDETFVIDDPSQFIHDGGLFLLNDSCWNLNVNHLHGLKISLQGLEGLFSRSLDDTPAWVYGIQYPYTLDLIAQFIHEAPHAEARLTQSLDTLTPFQKHHCIEVLIQHRHTHEALVNTLITVVRAAFSPTYYQKQLTTWEGETRYATSLMEYCQKIVSHPGHHLNQLIEVSSNESVSTLQYALQKYCILTRRPVFYVSSPDHLRCQTPYLHVDSNGLGHYSEWYEGPGSVMMQFIRNAKDSSRSPVIIINYDNFKPAEIVQFHALLDSPRKADGVLLPDNTSIIGLSNIHHPQRYQGTDFYSRMTKQQCPLAEKDLTNVIPPLPLVKYPQELKVIRINLFNASDWKERLLGRFHTEGQVITFTKGPLIEALESNIPICIENGHHEDMIRFFQEAMLHKKIHYPGGEIALPLNFQFEMKEGYDWRELTTHVQLHQGLVAGAPTINPTRLTHCFQQIQCDNTTETMTETKGLLELAANMPLTLSVTRDLSLDEWAMLLTEAKKHHVTLTCALAPSVSLPEPLKQQIAVEKHTPEPTQVNKTRIIHSTDIDVTLANFTQSSSDWMIIDISECSTSDLLYKLSVINDREHRRFRFNESHGLLSDALKSNKKIILTGTCSLELADELSDVLLKRQMKESNPGELVIITTKPELFPTQVPEIHDIQTKEKIELLSRHYLREDIEKFITQYPQDSLAKLRARLAYHNLHPEQSSDKAWDGVYHLDIHFESTPWDKVNAKTISNMLIQNRLDEIDARLSYEPYVLLSGLTATGKSTFVERYLSKKNTVLMDVHAWATSKNTGRKILFIDEANLSSRQWSEFEGLYQSPPHIFVDGLYYELTPEHKVVFAANPLSYGDRTLPAFFEQHGNSLIFEPLPHAFIYEKIINPIFERTLVAHLSEEIARELLSVYSFLCQHSKQEVLISPREIQMMALLIVASINERPDENLLEIAKEHRYTIAKSILTNSKLEKNVLDEFERTFKPENRSLVDSTLSLSYTHTHSRAPVKKQLLDMLSVRMEKRRARQDDVDAKIYGGLSGLVIEGPPGIGKTELIKVLLAEQGYREQSLGRSTQKIPSDKRYYNIPANMLYDDKKNLLCQAFEEGAIVVMDEINSSSMMESLLNDLLMGYSPDKKRPQNPGFLVLGTQNPSTFQGRRTMGNALARRFITTQLPDYDTQEKVTILTKMGLSSEKAIALVNVYNERQTYAAHHHLTPAPTFRDLYKLAKTEIHTKHMLDNEDSPEQRLTTANTTEITRQHKEKLQNTFTDPESTDYRFKI